MAANTGREEIMKGIVGLGRGMMEQAYCHAAILVTVFAGAGTDDAFATDLVQAEAAADDDVERVLLRSLRAARKATKTAEDAIAR